MKINAITFEELQRPTYILEEAKLRNNLSLISSIAKEADIEIILAFKAYALWKTFPIFANISMPQQLHLFTKQN